MDCRPIKNCGGWTVDCGLFTYLCPLTSMALTTLPMKLLIINGPNLNLLGVREKSVYGNRSFEDYFEELKTSFPDVELEYFQSNTEGTLIDKIHETGFSYKGIILNAGAYTQFLHECITELRAGFFIILPVQPYISRIYKNSSMHYAE